MSELCKKCFIDTWNPSELDIAAIVMSKDETLCEGCCSIGTYVDHLDPEIRVYGERILTELKNMAASKSELLLLTSEVILDGYNNGISPLDVAFKLLQKE